MALPPIFDRLRLPVIGSPLFIVSGPELVIAQCKAGIVGSFPGAQRAAADAARRMAAPDHRGTRRVGPRQSRPPVRALCGQPDRPQIERPARCRTSRPARSGRCRSPSPRSARARNSTRRCTAGAASRCTTSSTTASRARRSKRAPTA